MTRATAPLSAAARAAFVAAARARVGVKFRHQGRSATHLDCIGLMVTALADAGTACNDRRAYGRDPARDDLRSALRQHFGPPAAIAPDLSAVKPGDIALMAWHLRPQHVAVFGDYAHGGLSLIHADAQFGAVVEHAFAAPWIDRVAEVYRP